jgi:hypothetical protein
MQEAWAVSVLHKTGQRRFPLKCSVPPRFDGTSSVAKTEQAGRNKS